MNARSFTALIALGLWLVSFAARADDGTASAHFASTVGTEALRQSACSMKPIITEDGRSRPVDVVVEGRRCESALADSSAIPLFVRTEAGETRHVVLETSAPREALAEIARVLAARVAITMALRPIVIRDAGFPTPSAQDAPTFDMKAWHRMHHQRDGGLIAAIVIPSVLAGVALFVGIGFALSACHGCLSFGNYY